MNNISGYDESKKKIVKTFIEDYYLPDFFYNSSFLYNLLFKNRKNILGLIIIYNKDSKIKEIIFLFLEKNIIKKDVIEIKAGQ